MARGQLLDGRLDFAFFNPVVLVILVLTCETLPGQRTFEQVKQNISH